MATIAIRSDVPLPSPSGRGRRASKYPFSKMEVGDSFVVNDVTARTVRSAVSVFQRKYDVKFAVRTTDEGIGVWRVA